MNKDSFHGSFPYLSNNSSNRTLELNSIRMGNHLIKEELTDENLFSEKDQVETITESEEDDESGESQQNDSMSSSKSKNHNSKLEHGRWTDKEHYLFLEGLIKYGNEWKMVQKHIQTRSSTQARSHAQKFFIRIKKMITSETSQVTIRKTIYEIFEKKLQGLFKPKNLIEFLDKMATLVFASDYNNKKPNTPLRKPTMKEINNLIPSVTSEIDKNSINTGLKQKNSFVHSMAKKRDTYPSIQKEKYFDIEKDNDKVSLKAYRMACINNNSFNFNEKTYFENSSQTTQQTPPSDINYVTINIVNNSKNTYIQNSIDQPKKRLFQEHKTNPFNLQFEEILNQSAKNNCSCYDNNPHINVDQYNDADMSLSSFDLC